MKSRSRSMMSISSVIAFAASTAHAQPAPAAATPAPATAARAQPAQKLTAAQRRDAVEKLAAALEQHYVFPDKGRTMAQQLRQRLAHGDYEALTSGEPLAEALTAQLVALSHDKHLEVRYMPAPPSPTPGTPPPGASDRAAEPDEADEQRYANYGISEARRIKLNIGYLRFGMFGRPVAPAGDKLAAAMRLLGDTAGLVIDLRECHGGDTDTVALAQSYFVPARTHLVDFYTRDTNATEHIYAAAELAGPRYAAAKPVAILVGDATASGCEAFAYALQAQHRATVIGDHTAGAAYFGSPRRLTPQFMAFVPVGRPIDPITHGDWEGTGVTPTISAPPERALDQAELAILRALLPHESQRSAAMQKRIAELAAPSPPHH